MWFLATLPETGIDLEGMTEAAILGLGSIVVVVAGGYFGFLLVRLGLRWASAAGGYEPAKNLCPMCGGDYDLCDCRVQMGESMKAEFREWDRQRGLR